MKYYKVKILVNNKWNWIRHIKQWGNTEIAFSTSERRATVISETALGNAGLVALLSSRQFELKEVNKDDFRRGIVNFPEELASPFEATRGRRGKYYKVRIYGYNKAYPDKDWLCFNQKCFYFDNHERATIFSYDRLNSELFKYYLGQKGFIFLEEVAVI